MKWNVVSKNPSAPGYGSMDMLVAFAAQHDMAVHGHTLWWHEAVPDVLHGASGPHFAEQALTFLEQTARRYAGRLHSWDVVNEPLDEHRPGEMRLSPFMAAFGPDYIGLAFGRVHEIDPAAVLVLNEMGLEYASAEAERKRRAMLALLERECANGTPIHCLGIQSHLRAIDQPREHPEFRAFLREVRALGLKVMITEMDVSDAGCNGGRRERDLAVSEAYRAYIDLVLEESHALGVCTWGLSDDRSWLNAGLARPHRSLLRPLLLSPGLRRKPAWHAVRAALCGNR